MQQKRTRTIDCLASARARSAEDLAALEKVRDLLAKADERRVREPEEARKWNKVLENLENSLDLTKARYEQSLVEVERIAAAEQEPVEVEKSEDTPADQWSDTIRKVERLNLEEASQLQSEIDQGHIHDMQLEAGLALANQLSEREEEEAIGVENRRQAVLRAAIDKIKKQQFNMMSLEEIKLVLACHSLLTSKLEPTSRDQRLRRILDGASKILQRRKGEMEGR